MPKTETKLHSADRFAPCLLSRLIDREPQIRSERIPPIITADQLRQDVLRNLEIIFNSRSRLSDSEMGDSKEITSSVLGFGLSDFCGISKDSDIGERLRDAIIRQIHCFEPRIRRDSLEVSIVQGSGNLKELEFLISGIIVVSPLKAEIFCTSKLDLDTGGVSIAAQQAERDYE